MKGSEIKKYCNNPLAIAIVRTGNKCYYGKWITLSTKCTHISITLHPSRMTSRKPLMIEVKHVLAIVTLSCEKEVDMWLESNLKRGKISK
jgi:hypothetical protein